MPKPDQHPTKHRSTSLIFSNTDSCWLNQLDAWYKPREIHVFDKAMYIPFLNRALKCFFFMMCCDSMHIHTHTHGDSSTKSHVDLSIYLFTYLLFIVYLCIYVYCWKANVLPNSQPRQSFPVPTPCSAAGLGATWRGSSPGIPAVTLANEPSKS